jgi:hypothetical protein
MGADARGVEGVAARVGCERLGVGRRESARPGREHHPLGVRPGKLLALERLERRAVGEEEPALPSRSPR